MMQFVNLTPHEITIFADSDATSSMVLPRSGQIARVSSATQVVHNDWGFPVVRTTFGTVEGLPDQAEGVALVVSGMVLDAMKASGVYRNDLFAPGQLLRDASGAPMGCIGLRK
jgi:hypothetical protein